MLHCCLGFVKRQRHFVHCLRPFDNFQDYCVSFYQPYPFIFFCILYMITCIPMYQCQIHVYDQGKKSVFSCSCNIIKKEKCTCWIFKKYWTSNLTISISTDIDKCKDN